MTVFGKQYSSGAISLARYAELINYSDCAFFGVAWDSDPNRACRSIWTLQQRNQIALYLREAQREIEQVVGYPLTPTWIANERVPYAYPVLARNSRLLEVGVKAEDELSASAAVSYATEPATVSLATTLTSTSGIEISYPEDNSVEITPSDIQISGGTLTISIPKCRLVKYSLRDNPTSGLLYSDPTNFQAAVRVARVYTDPSTQASLTWPHGCNQLCSSSGCAEYTELACEVITNHRVGVIEVVPASYSGGAWTPLTRVCCGGIPEYISLNYKAGPTELSDIMEMSIVRLAHSKMPMEPCGCDVIHNLWQRDSNVPKILTRERLECPFGLSDGAWMAWQFVSAEASVRMGVFA